MQAVELLIGTVEEILVADAPRPGELRRCVILLIDHAVETIAEEKATHVVEVTLPAVVEGSVVAARLEGLRQGVEPLLRFGLLHHCLGGRGGKPRDHGLNASHAARAGGVHLGECPRAFAQSIQVWRQRQAAQVADELCAQALLQHDHEVPGFSGVGRYTRGKRGDVRVGEGDVRQATGRTDGGDHVLLRQRAIQIHGAVFLLQPLSRGIGEGIEGIERQLVDQRVGAERDHCRIQGPMAERGARPQRRQEQYQHGAHGPLYPGRGRLRTGKQAPRPRPTRPQCCGRHDRCEDQLPWTPIPQGGKHLARVGQVFDEKAVGTQAVLAHEAGGCQFQQQQQGQARRQPERRDGVYGPPRRQQQQHHRRQPEHQAQRGYVHAHTLQQHR